MLTTEKETDYPAAMIACDREPGFLVYYSDEHILVRPPCKVLRMVEEYGIKPPGYEVF